MDSKSIYKELIIIAEKFGYEVKESRMGEDISSSGGKIKLKNRNYILLNTNAKIEDRINSIINILKEENLDSIHINPFIRETFFKK